MPRSTRTTAAARCSPASRRRSPSRRRRPTSARSPTPAGSNARSCRRTSGPTAPPRPRQRSRSNSDAAAHRPPARRAYRRALARGVHERARPRDRECRDPAARGRARHERGPGYLGHHIVRRECGDRHAAHRLARPALWGGTRVPRLYRHVHPRLAALWPLVQPRHADRDARHPGRVRRPDDPAVAEPAAQQLSRRPQDPRARVAHDGDDCRAGARPDSRRLDHRQLELGVDLLYQRAGRHRRHPAHRRAAAPVGLLPMALVALIARYSSGIDLRWITPASLCAFGAASFRFAGFNTEVSFPMLAWSRFAQGVGLALFFVPLMSIVLSGLPPGRVASASGLANTLRTLAGSFATSLTTTWWDRREALHQAHLSESITLFNSPAQGQTAFATLERSIVQQAYMLATNDLFWLWGWIFLALIAVVWFARPPFSAAGTHAAAD